MTTIDFTPGANSSQCTIATHASGAADGAAHFPDGHHAADAQQRSAVGDQTPPAPAKMAAAPMVGSLVREAADLPDGHDICDTQVASAVGDLKQPAPARDELVPSAAPPVLAFTPWTGHNGPLLALLADALDDIENIRKATANRLRQLTRDQADKDGEERGFGLTLEQPQVIEIAALLRRIKHDDKVLKALGCPIKAVKGDSGGRSCACMECCAVRNLQKELRAHPLGPWVESHPGVGEKQAARLIAAIGDPYWNTLHDRPRLVSELWQYAGHGDPARSKKHRGQTVEHSPTAKMRTHLVAVSCMKNRNSIYREVYEKRKAQTEGRVHATACVRCGPSGKPAQPGTPWSDAHRHADALRITGKEILRDLWAESKRLHEAA